MARLKVVFRKNSLITNSRCFSAEGEVYIQASKAMDTGEQETEWESIMSTGMSIRKP